MPALARAESADESVRVRPSPSESDHPASRRRPRQSGLAEPSRPFRFGPALRAQGSTPFLTIGIHRLEGKFVDLKKPLVVLDPSSDDDASKFVVAGVVRRKALFKMRPKVLINKSVIEQAASSAS